MKYTYKYLCIIMVYIYIVDRVYCPTYNWGDTIWLDLWQF